MVIQLTIPIIFFIVIFLLGYRLRLRGKPYSTLLITVHKLTALGLGIYLAVMINKRHQIIPLNPIEITAATITILLFLINVATGSFMSTDKNIPQFVSQINKVVPYITVLATGITIALVAGLT
jgi:Ni,Fe-hydrogenase I cytochrome b subunit